MPAASLVPGDVVDLRCGDKVPADCRIAQLKTASFRVEQSQLTGESVAVLKVGIASRVHGLGFIVWGLGYRGWA